MNKKKRISLSAPQSRSSRMRNIQTIQTNVNNSFDTSTSSLVPRGPLDYSKDELEKYIRDNPNNYCNVIMGVSCGDGGDDDTKKWEELSPYWKWVIAGGKCPGYFENKRSAWNCTTGCKKYSGGPCA
jgi:hypothetical protein